MATRRSFIGATLAAIAGMFAGVPKLFGREIPKSTENIFDPSLLPPLGSYQLFSQDRQLAGGVERTVGEMIVPWKHGHQISSAICIASLVREINISGCGRKWIDLHGIIQYEFARIQIEFLETQKYPAATQNTPYDLWEPDGTSVLVDGKQLAVASCSVSEGWAIIDIADPSKQELHFHANWIRARIVGKIEIVPRIQNTNLAQIIDHQNNVLERLSTRFLPPIAFSTPDHAPFPYRYSLFTNLLRADNA